MHPKNIDGGKRADKKDRVILILDDEDDLRDLAKTIFEKKGFKVLLADNGQNALKVFQEHAEEIDLRLLDLILPGMDGSEVYHRLKKSQTEPKDYCHQRLSN
ncbi:response regulator [candidate division KSB1 bacterium]|nr:response regulator [candidate division KSB1 bacterium]NIR71449.1 response regulator [candidate division KSB1 bacterium]NIS23370.1 response regulator [candidate division KSB1 bacterium]NIT70261.1 response regulator [candidate division KSB1 bacterium]NIU23984.1 response regulator [candidate division KSB1 bacterium]